MAKARGGKITKDFGRRIARVVERVERTPRPKAARPPGGEDTPFQFRRFVCKDALTPAEGNPGTTTTAYLVKWNFADEEFEVNTNIEFEVRDPGGSRYAPAYDEDNWYRFIGWCVKAFDLPEWEIFYLPQYGKIKALTKGAVASGDGTYTVDNVTVMRGVSPKDDPTSTTETKTIQNTFQDELDDNAVITASHNKTTGLWDTDDIICAED